MVSFRGLGVVLIAFYAVGTGNSYANEYLDRGSMPTDSRNQNIFTRNMSTLDTGKSLIGVRQVSGTRRIDVIGSPGTSNQDRINYEIKEKDQSIGFILPLGGAAFGADTTLTARDVGVTLERTSRPLTETFRDRYWRAHFIVDLTPNTFASFSYRYLQTESEIYGDFFLDVNDRTDYLGELSGYMVSFFTKDKSFGWGGYYAPALRGKSEVEGEQKILTTPGTGGLNGDFAANNQIVVGLDVTRWFYKKDDRGVLSTSPIDQRTISLNGLDLEQRFLKTQRVSLGIDYLISKELKLRGNLYKQDAVWLFREDQVPGDEPTSETAMSHYGAKASFYYDAKSYFLEFGIVKVSRERAAFDDTRSGGSWFGHGTYGDYKAAEDYTALSFGFQY